AAAALCRHQPVGFCEIRRRHGRAIRAAGRHRGIVRHGAYGCESFQRARADRRKGRSARPAGGTAVTRSLSDGTGPHRGRGIMEHALRVDEFDPSEAPQVVRAEPVAAPAARTAVAPLPPLPNLPATDAVLLRRSDPDYTKYLPAANTRTQ